MDRNARKTAFATRLGRRPPRGGVDRNHVEPTTIDECAVAPRAGAWIETMLRIRILAALIVAPRAGAWIETRRNGTCRVRYAVAPRAGAWIETVSTIDALTLSRSPPARGRGSKHPCRCLGRRGAHVAPRAGAWIETRTTTRTRFRFTVAPRAGAWIETTTTRPTPFSNTSPPARGRGSKRQA